jgi:phosphoglycerol transferase
VPLMVLVVVWLALGEQFLIYVPENQRWPRLDLSNHKAIISVIVCVIVGSCGVYYPYFSCFLLLVAGLTSWWNRRSFSYALTAVLLIGLVAGTVMVNHLASIAYQRTHGSVAMGSRSAGDAEVMGLKLTQLVLPIGGHRWEPLGALKYRYNLGPLVNENDTASLGFIGSVGFLILIGAIFSRRKAPDIIDRLSLLNVSAFLLATIGGFGVLFALLVSAQIRAYNRISVFIAFFSLITIAWLLDVVLRKLPAKRLRIVYYLGLTVIVVIGVLDQTTTTFFFVPEYEKIKREYQSDSDFVGRIESSVPEHSMIFQLPYVPFPESPTVHNMIDHEHFKAYLHSKTLRWSYGIPVGEKEDVWQREIATLPASELVERVRAAGFAGIYLNRDGYEDRGMRLETDLISLLKIQPIVNNEGNLVFFKL